MRRWLITTIATAVVGMIVVIVGFRSVKRTRAEIDASPHADDDD